MSGPQPDFSSVKANPAWKIAIVRSMWHGDLTGALSADARAAFLSAGLPAKNVTVIDAPGSFEVPLLAKAAVEKGANGIIAFGVIVQGDTHHARLLADTSARALMDLQTESGVPVAFEILFVDDVKDAEKRSVGPCAKGALAAHTLLTTLAKLGELQS